MKGWKVKILTRFLIISNLVLLVLCIYNKSLPQISADAKVLFPYQSQRLELINLLDTNFDSSAYDVLAIKNVDFEKEYFELEELEEDLLSVSGINGVISPLLGKLVKGFIVRDSTGSAGRFIIQIDNNLSEDEGKRLNFQINELIKQYSKFEIKRSGTFYVTHTLTREIEKETFKLVSVSSIFLIIFLVAYFRSLIFALLVLSACGLSLFTTILFATAFSISLNPISQLAPPFILAVGSAYSIHFLINFIDKGKVDARVVRSIAFATITTSIGILSLYFLQVRGVSDFATLASLGNLLAALYSFLITVFLAPKKNIKEIYRFEHILVYRKYLILPLSFIALIAMFGLHRLEIDTDPVSFLPQEIRKEIKEVSSIFQGNKFISLVISNKDNRDFNFSSIKELSFIGKRLREERNIYSIIDPAIVVKELERLGEDKIPNFLISYDAKHLRFVYETSFDGKKLLEQISGIKEDLVTRFDGKLGFTSFEVIMSEQSAHITQGVIESLFYTIGILFLMMIYLTRSFVVSALSLIPNLIPIVAVFGSIGIFFGQISLSASLVASCALAIAVDNTYHFISCWMEKVDSSDNPITASLAELVNPFIITSLTISIGFSGLLFAKVLPTFQFGLLLIISLIVGVLSDLIVLPYLLGLISKNSAPSK